MFYNIKSRYRISINSLPAVMALYYVIIVNVPIVREFSGIFNGLESVKIGFVLSVPLFFFAVFNFIFHVFNWPYIAKPFFVFLLLTSALVSYAMFSYGVYIDYGMVENVFETNTGEAISYLSVYSVVWFLLMGVIPAILLSMTKLEYDGVKTFLLWKVVGMGVSLVIIGIIAAFYYKDYASVGRNNHQLKKLIIPTEYVWSTANYINDTYIKEPVVYQQIGTDAKLSEKAQHAEKPTLLVFVLGETARVFNYQYYGYDKPTNQHTSVYKPIFFSHVTSCGTATAVSVPCMFSNMNRNNYSKEKAYNQDNVVDIMSRAGIRSVWREHDGGDKGVAHHIKKMTLMPNDTDPLCNSDNCYDTALLENFAEDTKDLDKDNIIFYHISGSHGPTYYERYPKDHRQFLPDCQRADIENCTNEELINTYDNTILYADYFVSEAIKNLKGLTDKYNVGLIYISDHGESLGEDGVYLHGMPYAIAPKEQTHVPLLMWFSENFYRQKNLDEQCLRKLGEDQPFSHDNVFDSLLGIMDVLTSEYRKNQDIFAPCRS